MILETYYPQLTSAYAMAFLALGLVLVGVRIPSHEPTLRNYYTGRRIFGYAYLMLGVTGILELFAPALPARDYTDLYCSFAISMLHAWLNAMAYLTMLDPAEKSRRRFVLYGRWGLSSLLLLGAATVFLPATHGVCAVLFGIIYTAQVVLMMYVCKSEYKACVRSLDNYFEDSPRFGWMNVVIDLSFVTAFFNAASFYVPDIALPMRVVNVAFYIYVAIRILNYIPMFIFVGEARQTDNDDTQQEPNDQTHAEQVEFGVALQRRIKRWIAEGKFCFTPLKITDVATQIGTNRSYLSTYLNQQLGITYRQWLNTLRVERAKELLNEYPEMPVAQVGQMVGMPEAYNFSHWFKLVTGLSPVQWRNR